MDPGKLEINVKNILPTYVTEDKTVLILVGWVDRIWM
jgi:hypothetical protein